MVSKLQRYCLFPLTYLEHTLLVTEDGVEILTARFPDSPGGPVPLLDPAPAASNGDATAAS